ncbi:hypothetical protein CUC44_06785 [Aeromonas lusitana]|uniref:Uncharacterized protein n=1 Tax=Aeromonas lusitana TaxID=931529 RepID=A0A2M8HBP0_9GAMM|nr:hypothetical protein CUC44_06785 [Aeromonas lusitana]
MDDSATLVLQWLPRSCPEERTHSSFQSSGFRIQDSGFRIQDSGFWVLGSGFWVLGSGLR